MSDQWQPYNNGTGKRMWFCARRVGGKTEYHLNRAGNLIWYTAEGAKAKARQLNAA